MIIGGRAIVQIYFAGKGGKKKSRISSSLTPEKKVTPSDSNFTSWKRGGADQNVNQQEERKKKGRKTQFCVLAQERKPRSIKGCNRTQRKKALNASSLKKGDGSLHIFCPRPVSKTRERKGKAAVGTLSSNGGGGKTRLCIISLLLSRGERTFPWPMKPDRCVGKKKKGARVTPRMQIAQKKKKKEECLFNLGQIGSQHVTPSHRSKKTNVADRGREYTQKNRRT